MSSRVTTRISASRLVALALGRGRRATRTVRLTRLGEAPCAFRGQERVELGSDWVRFRVGQVTFDARVDVPPLLAVHKPGGVVVSRSERGSDLPTLWESFSHVPELAALEAVGRLDAESEGLLLLTGDGRLLHGLTRPSSAVPRRYLAFLETAPEPEAIDRLDRGELLLRDGHRPRPLSVARAIPPDAFAGCREPGECWEIVLAEGKYHEVRRAFAACGARVMRLVRTAFGPVELTGPVAAPGGWMRIDGDLKVATYSAAGVAGVADHVDVRLVDRSAGELEV